MTLKRFAFTIWMTGCVRCSYVIRRRWWRRCKWNREKMHIQTNKVKVQTATIFRVAMPMSTTAITTIANAGWGFQFFQCAVLGFSLIFVLFLVDITWRGFSLSLSLHPGVVWCRHTHTNTLKVHSSFRFNIERPKMCHKCNKYYLVE